MGDDVMGCGVKYDKKDVKTHWISLWESWWCKQKMC